LEFLSEITKFGSVFNVLDDEESIGRKINHINLTVSDLLMFEVEIAKFGQLKNLKLCIYGSFCINF